MGLKSAILGYKIALSDLVSGLSDKALSDQPSEASNQLTKTLIEPIIAANWPSQVSTQLFVALNYSSQASNLPSQATNSPVRFQICLFWLQINPLKY